MMEMIMSATGKSSYNDPLIPAASSATSKSSSQNVNDPYSAFRDELKVQFSHLNSRFQQWRDAVEKTNTATNKEFQELNTKVREQAAELYKSVSDLELVVGRVTSSRAKYPHISDVELESRKKFVQDLKRDIQRLVTSMNSHQFQGKIERDKFNELMSRKTMEKQSKVVLYGNQPEYMQISDEENEKENGRRQNNQQTKQQVVQNAIEQQDEILDAISIGVRNLHGVGDAISDEIKKQGVALDDIESGLDTNEAQLGGAMGRLEKLLKTDNRCQTKVIVSLFGLLLLLTLLVGLS